STLRRGPRRTNPRDLHDRVDQDVARCPLELGLHELAFDQEATPGLDRPGTTQAQLRGLDRQPLANVVRLSRGRFDLEVPQHRGGGCFVKKTKGQTKPPSTL